MKDKPLLPKTAMLAKTLSTLDKDSVDLVEFVRNSSVEFFGKHQKVEPCFFFTNGKESKVYVTPVTMPKDGDEKEKLFWLMRKVREKFPLAAFVTEVWMSHCEGKEIKCLPSEDPNRKEALMITLWTGKRTVVFASIISRNPDRLGEWYTANDTHFAGLKPGDTMVGRAIDGHALSVEDN